MTELSQTKGQRYYVIECNNIIDSDIIRVLENESNKNAFIKDCIRKVVAAVERSKDNQ